MPEPTLLSSPEYAFISTMVWMSRWSGRLLAPLGLQGVHAHTMARLHETPGLTQRELADRIHRDAPATSRILDEMTKMGLVERRVDPKDRRRRRIHLTRKARRLQAKVEELFAAARAEAGIELRDDDVASLWRVADHLQRRYRAALGEPSPAQENKTG